MILKVGVSELKNQPYCEMFPLWCARSGASGEDEMLPKNEHKFIKAYERQNFKSTNR